MYFYLELHVPGATMNTPRILPWLVALSCAVLSGNALPDAKAQAPSFDLMEKTIPQLQAALSNGTITSKALVAAYLARVEAYDKHGPALNAVSVINNKALDEAAALDAERRAGKTRGLLHGVPMIVKDNYETAGMQTASGSLSMAGWVSPDDAVLVKKLREAGAIIIAKSNMQEFARGITTVGSLFGATRNPYALDRNPGGSSGGTGAAVAASFAAVGMGSDTCGSIRVPAAYNSLVGLRGTQGLASRSGIVPLSSTLDIGGPIGRTVTDIAIVLDAIVGYDPADAQTAASVGNIPRTYTDALQLDGLRRARIGLLTDLFVLDPTDAEVATSVRLAIDEMKGLGAEVVEITIPDVKQHMNDGTVSNVDFKFDLNAYLARRPSAPVHTLEEVLASGKYHKSIETALRNAQAYEARESSEYLQHWRMRDILREAILKVMADNTLDALAYPSVRLKPSLIGEAQGGNNCRLSSNSGLPSIVVPGGFTPDGLPIGVELLGRPWGESQLIKFGYAYEQGTNHRRSPSSTPPLGRS